MRQPGVRELPQIILSGRTSIDIDPEIATQLYEIAGFKVTGNRAVRVDILERLADLIRPLIAFDPKRNQDSPPEGAAEGNGFRVTVEMTSLLGCAGEEFSTVLTSLGYKVTKTLIETAPVAPETGDDIVVAANNNEPQGEAVTEVTEPQVAAKSDVVEPQFDEVWHPAPRRNNNQQHNKTREQNRKQFAKGNKDNKPGNKKPNQHKRPSKPQHKPKPIDPDSPFAALAALKK